MLDLPTGATIVCTFGLVLILMAVVRVLVPRKGAARRDRSGGVSVRGDAAQQLSDAAAATATATTIGAATAAATAVAAAAGIAAAAVAAEVAAAAAVVPAAGPVVRAAEGEQLPSEPEWPECPECPECNETWDQESSDDCRPPLRRAPRMAATVNITIPPATKNSTSSRFIGLSSLKRRRQYRIAGSICRRPFIHSTTSASDTPRCCCGRRGSRTSTPLAEMMTDERDRPLHRRHDAARDDWRALMTMIGSWHAHGFAMFSVIEKATGRWIGRRRSVDAGGLAGAGDRLGHRARLLGPRLRAARRPSPPRTGRSSTLGWTR